ncbi:MAG: ornithine cyclodeaminase family protein [Deltaproteobacteria bacterium]|nr:ornithine cyclodeaminase family protein [Deltaproteobacteria bacterium]
MLCISEKDIHAAINLNEAVDKIEEALKFYETGNFLMPLRVHLDYGPNTLLLMPCFTPQMFGTKLLTLFPGNANKNKPVIEAVMIINDAETGEPLALINGRVMTAMRTGAVGGVGVRHLSPSEPHTLGIVGTGVQGFQQARFAATLKPINRIMVYDSLPKKAPEFASRLEAALPGIPVNPVSSIEELLSASQTVITATTSNLPVLPDNKELLAGKHFVGIGSYKPDMREFPESLFRLLDYMFIDTGHAIDEAGDVIDPLKNNWLSREQVATMGQFLLNQDKYRPAAGATTLFKSVGMGLFDVFASELIYQKTKEKGLGLAVTL